MTSKRRSLRAPMREAWRRRRTPVTPQGAACRQAQHPPRPAARVATAVAAAPAPIAGLAAFAKRRPAFTAASAMISRWWMISSCLVQIFQEPVAAWSAPEAAAAGYCGALPESGRPAGRPPRPLPPRPDRGRVRLSTGGSSAVSGPRSRSGSLRRAPLAAP